MLRYDDPRWFSNHARNQEVIITSLAHHTGKILLASFVALALAATASARTDAKVIAHGALLKDGKTGYAQATAAKPASLSVMVQTTPAVKVKIQYSVICTASSGSTTNSDGEVSSTTPSSGTLEVKSPSTSKLKLPLAHPGSCSLTVYTTLPKKGPKETLEILQA